MKSLRSGGVEKGGKVVVLINLTIPNGSSFGLDARLLEQDFAI